MVKINALMGVNNVYVGKCLQMTKGTVEGRTTGYSGDPLRTRRSPDQTTGVTGTPK